MAAHPRCRGTPARLDGAVRGGDGDASDDVGSVTMRGCGFSRASHEEVEGRGGRRRGSVGRRRRGGAGERAAAVQSPLSGGERPDLDQVVGWGERSEGSWGKWWCGGGSG